MHLSAEFFNRWYIGAFLVVWGASLIVRRRSLNDIRDNFDDDGRPGIKAVAERRQRLEARPLATWYVTGGCSIALGIAALAGVLNGGLAYALSCTLLVSMLTAGYLRMRNAGPRRAAPLAPRRPGSFIPWPWYPIGVLAGLTPLAFLDVPSQRLAAALVTLSAFAIMALAIRAEGMAALLTGDDVDLELYVDDRLRRLRVNALWTIGMVVPFVYVVMTGVGLNATLFQVIVSYFDFIAALARLWPQLVCMVRRLART